MKQTSKGLYIPYTRCNSISPCIIPKYRHSITGVAVTDFFFFGGVFFDINFFFGRLAPS